MAISSHRNRVSLENVPQIGDRVRVKDLKDILSITGPGRLHRVYKYHNGQFTALHNLSFPEDMDFMCGREYFVEGIDENSDTVYLMGEPKRDGGYPWWFHYDFLEEV